MDGFDISIYGTKKDGLVTITDIELIFELQQQYRSVLLSLFSTSLTSLVKELRGCEDKINAVSLEYDAKSVLHYLCFMTEDGNDTVIEYPQLTEMELFDVIRVMYILFCRDRLTKFSTEITLPYQLDLQRGLIRHLFGDVIFVRSPNCMVRFEVCIGDRGTLDAYTTICCSDNDDAIEIRGSLKFDLDSQIPLPRIVLVNI